MNSLLFFSLTAIYSNSLITMIGSVQATSTYGGGLRSQNNNKLVLPIQKIDKHTKETRTLQVPGGYSVTCIGGDGKIYRLEAGVLRHYPTGTVAHSWDPNWRRPQWTDCTGLTFGEPLEVYEASKSPTSRPTNMPIRNIGVAHGAAVRCSGNDSAIYRWHHGKLRHYPSGNIANSWDRYWRNPVNIDCDGLSYGDPMELFVPTTAPSPPPVRNIVNLSDGSTVRCSGNTNTAYRWANNRLYQYADATVADSWYEFWRNSKVVDCTGLQQGGMMQHRPAVGSSVVCTDNLAKVYWYTGNELRHFPSGAIAYSWDPNFRNFETIDCTGHSYGPAMMEKGAPTPAPTIDPTGTTGTTNDTTGNVTGGSTGDATSGTGTTGTTTTTGSTTTTQRAKSVQCSDKQDYRVYRYADNELRHYPSAIIASSWDTNWRSFESIVCAGIPIGDALDVFDPAVDPTQHPTPQITNTPTKSPVPLDVCDIAESLPATGTIDNSKMQDLCIASQWAVTFFDEKKPKMMERMRKNLQESSRQISDPELCGCVAVCQGIAVLCEMACVLAPIGPCEKACKAASTSCNAHCELS